MSSPIPDAAAETTALQLLHERVGLWVAQTDPLYPTFRQLVERGQADAGATERGGTIFYYREPEQPYVIPLMLWPDQMITPLAELTFRRAEVAARGHLDPLEVLVIYVQVVGMPRLVAISTYTGFLAFPAIIAWDDETYHIDTTRPLCVLAPEQQARLAQWMRETSWEAWGSTRWELRAQLGVTEQMVSLRDAGEPFGLAYSTIYRYAVRAKKLPVFDLGNTYIYPSTVGEAIRRGVIPRSIPEGGLSATQQALYQHLTDTHSIPRSMAQEIVLAHPDATPEAFDAQVALLTQVAAQVGVGDPVATVADCWREGTPLPIPLEMMPVPSVVATN